MTEINQNILIIIQYKCTKFSKKTENLGRKSNYILFKNKSVKQKDTKRMQEKDSKKTYRATIRQNEGIIAMFLSEKIDNKAERVTRHKEVHYVMIKVHFTRKRKQF